MAYRCSKCEAKIAVDDINEGKAAILGDNNMYCKECLPEAQETVKQAETQRREKERAASVDTSRTGSLRAVANRVKVTGILCCSGFIVGGALVWMTSRPMHTKIGVTIGAVSIAIVICLFAHTLHAIALSVADQDETQKQMSKTLEGIRRGMEHLA